MPCISKKQIPTVVVPVVLGIEIKELKAGEVLIFLKNLEFSKINCYYLEKLPL
jgi:hypothetical protein